MLIKRVLWVFIPPVVVFVVGVSLLDGYLIYKLTHPAPTQLYGTPRDFQVILQKPMWFEEQWRNLDGTQSRGWFLTAGKTSPAIVLSHAYGSNRSELLTLGFEIWKAGYNVMLYDLRGHGESPVKWSGLGSYEKDDLISGIEMLRNRKDENGQPICDGRIGLYGVDLGGYISLVAAGQSPLVKAVAVDSTCPDMPRLINYRLSTFVGAEKGWSKRLIDSEFTKRMMSLGMRTYMVRTEGLPSPLETVTTKADRRYLFIIGKDSGALEATTRELYAKTVDPKQLIEVEKSRLERLYDPDSAAYDTQVVAFFREAIPISGGAQGRKTK